MSLYLFFQFIDFGEGDELIAMEIVDNDHLWEYDDYRDVPFRLLERKMDTFAPTIKDDKPCLWVRLYD